MPKLSKFQEHWIGIAHTRVPLKVLDSPAWRVLSFSEKALYIDMRAKVRSTNNGNINATLSEMKHRGWSSSATLWKGLKTLEHMGLISRTRAGGIGAMSKICNLYRFTDMPVLEFPKLRINEIPATNDYIKIDSVKEAKARITEWRRQERAKQDARRESKHQHLKLVGSKSE